MVVIKLDNRLERESFEVKNLEIIMIKLAALLVLAYGISLQAATDKDAFFKEVKDNSGQYQLVKKNSDELCSDGNLAFVGGKVENGLHLGHHIFFGPFSDKANEQEANYCKISNDFRYTASSLTQTTKVYDCPEGFKQDESIETRTITFKSKEVFYESKEAKLKCHFVLSKKGDK